jgi:hypothetical protein
MRDLWYTVDDHMQDFWYLYCLVMCVLLGVS